MTTHLFDDTTHDHILGMTDDYLIFTDKFTPGSSVVLHIYWVGDAAGYLGWEWLYESHDVMTGECSLRGRVQSCKELWEVVTGMGTTVFNSKRMSR